MNQFNRFISQIGMKDADYYKCRQCGNPYLQRNRATIVARMRRLFSGYEVMDCLNCNTKWRIPRFWKRAS